MHHNQELEHTLEILTPAYRPKTIVGREQEHAALEDVLTSIGSRNLYVYGPRGTGKTLLTQATIEALPEETTTHYVPCTQYDSQYKVITRLYQLLTGVDKGRGHRTDQIQQDLTQHLTDSNTVIVLDDIDFLLANDGEDLLYYLSRMDNRSNTSIICVSTNPPDKFTQIEDRTLSSLQPWYVNIKAYTAPQVYRILEERFREGSLLDSVEREALTLIAVHTRNIQLGLLWLAQAAATADESITEDIVRGVKPAVNQSYREFLLSDFTKHHYTLLEAISQIETETQDRAATGAIYDRYKSLCQHTGEDPLTHRRIDDFLIQLELLDAIEINHRTGGTLGRTREIRLKQFL